MSKLKLNLEDLKVESFETTPDLSKNRGTINGQGGPGGALMLPPPDSIQVECETGEFCAGGGGFTTPDTCLYCPKPTEEYTCKGKFTCNQTCPDHYTCIGTCQGNPTCFVSCNCG